MVRTVERVCGNAGRPCRKSSHQSKSWQMLIKKCQEPSGGRMSPLSGLALKPAQALVDPGRESSVQHMRSKIDNLGNRQRTPGQR